MMKTLSLFPRKTAQPPLVGKTARTCTSMTVLFIRANRISPLAKNKQTTECDNHPAHDLDLAPDPSVRRRSFTGSGARSGSRAGVGSDREIFAMRACMSAAVIEYA